MKIFNKKARFNYHIIDTFEAGIMLEGSEVKSIRGGRVDLSDAFARVINGELILKNMFIPPYHGGVKEGYQPKRDRKLLIHKSQIEDLRQKLMKSSMTLIPSSLYTTRNLIKIELALASSKRKLDKKRAIKEREEARRLKEEVISY